MTPTVDWAAFLPQLFLGGGALFLLTFGTLARRRMPAWCPGALSLVFALGSLGSIIWLWVRVQDPARGPISTIAGTVLVDGFAVFLSGVVVISVLLALLFTPDVLRRADIPSLEFCVLMLLSAAGGVTLASANDLIVIFLGLEVLSISAYVLAAIDLRRMSSQEAGLKYFVLGAFASAFFLYGAALVYGAVGSTKLNSVAEFMISGGVVSDSMLLAGVSLLLVGLFFKVAAVPFHAWTPDVYEGAPPPATAYMAAGVKAAGFAALLRLFAGVFADRASDWRPIVSAVAVVTVVAGAALGSIVGDVRRLLAYSSISHAGFILVGLNSSDAAGTSAALFYLGVYALMAVGSFAVVSMIPKTEEGKQPLSLYDGLGRRSPFLALSFTFLLLAQAGLPFTTGFWAKFEVIGAAVSSGTYWLAAVAMLGAVAAAFLYLRLVVRMYLVRPPSATDAAAGEPSGKISSSDAAAAAASGAPAAAAPGAPAASGAPAAAVTLSRVAVPRSTGFVVAVCVLLTLLFGVWPAPVLELANDALLALVNVG